MSEATGAAGGTGVEGWQQADPAAAGGALGPPTATGPEQGGSTVTDTRPPHHQHAARQQTYGAPAPLPAGVPEQPPHQPAQAYVPPGAPAAAPAAHAGAGSTAGVRRPRPAARTAAPRTRKARLRVSRADPWSVMKVSFLLSIALGICTIVAVAVLWMVLDTIGVFSTVGSTISEATNSGTGKGFDLVSFLSLSRVVTFTAVIAVIDVVLATALATLGSFIYNMSAGMVGGIELTLAEDE